MREQSKELAPVQQTDAPRPRDSREAVPSIADGVKNSMLARMALLEVAIRAVGTEAGEEIKRDMLTKAAEEKLRTDVEWEELHRKKQIRAMGEYALSA